MPVTTDEDKATGEKKPGKKGISINKEQWGKIMESLEHIKGAVEDSSS